MRWRCAPVLMLLDFASSDSNKMDMWMMHVAFFLYWSALRSAALQTSVDQCWLTLAVNISTESCWTLNRIVDAAQRYVVIKRCVSRL